MSAFTNEACSIDVAIVLSVRLSVTHWTAKPIVEDHSLLHRTRSFKLFSSCQRPISRNMLHISPDKPI